jgi:hypothetical protein
MRQEMGDRPGEDAPAAGASDADEGWVPLAEAAQRMGCTEEWLHDRCRDGRLPSRPGPGSEPTVPLATVRAFVEGWISD